MAVTDLRRRMFDDYSSAGQADYGVPQYDIGSGVINQPDQSALDMWDPRARPQPTFEEEVMATPERDEVKGGYKYTDPRAPGTILNNPANSATPESQDLWAELNRINTPETAAMDRYNHLLDQFPEREKPSIMRALTASIGGFSHGVDEARKVMEEPNVRNRADWAAKAGPYYNAVQAETARNSQERQLASGYITNVAALKKAEIAAETQRQRNQIMKLKELNPHWVQIDDAPTIQFYDNKTGKTIDTKVPSTVVSDLDKIFLQNQGLRDAAEIRAGGTTGTGTGRPQTAADADKEHSNRLRELYYTDPQGKDFIEIRNGEFAIKPEPTMRNSYSPYSDPETEKKAIADYREFMRTKVFPPKAPTPTATRPGAGPGGSAAAGRAGVAPYTGSFFQNPNNIPSATTTEQNFDVNTEIPSETTYYNMDVRPDTYAKKPVQGFFGSGTVSSGPATGNQPIGGNNVIPPSALGTAKPTQKGDFVGGPAVPPDSKLTPVQKDELITKGVLAKAIGPDGKMYTLDGSPAARAHFEKLGYKYQ